ncbi:L-serine dehydratase [Diplonema papillatum]|nr:L-serine dehydratase [Diplonema papillatum]
MRAERNVYRSEKEKKKKKKFAPGGGSTLIPHGGRRPDRAVCPRALLGRRPPGGAEVVVEYDPAGSLATTAGSQGSNMGLAAGFLGFSCEDPRVCGSEALLEQAGVCFRTAVAAFPEHSHPNTYKVAVTERPGACARVVVALSLGGGALSIRSVDDAVLDSAGDRRAAVVAVPAGSPEHTAERVAAVFRDQAWLAVRAHSSAPRGASSRFDAGASWLKWESKSSLIQ